MIVQKDISNFLLDNPGLKKVHESKEGWFLKGSIKINAIKKNDFQLIGEFEIEMHIFKDFPNKLPIIREVSNKIPSEFEHMYENRVLCLGADEEVKIKIISENGNLKYWFENFVVNFFYSVLYFKKYHKLPYGERSHGILGLLEFYKEFLGVQDVFVIYQMITSIKNRVIDKESLCFCKSKKKTWQCHYNKMVTLMNIFPENRKHVVVSKFIYPYTNERVFKLYSLK